MNSNKSPGPDGYTALFYKNYWSSVGSDMVKAVQGFFKNVPMHVDFNHTFIALIPKNDRPCCVENFRPISLCNLVYKAISKIIADRLKSLLDKVISPFQFAFVEGRHIHENNILNLSLCIS